MGSRPSTSSPAPFAPEALLQRTFMGGENGGTETRSEGQKMVLAEIERKLGIAERLARCIEDPRAVRAGRARARRDDPLPCLADRRRLRGCQRLRCLARRSGLQDGGWPPAGERHRSLLPADHVPAREPAGAKRAEADDGRHDRAVLRQLRGRAAADRARHRRHRRCVHGGQQLALFHAHYDSRCFLPLHIYEATTGKPVAVILRPGKTPGGAEVALVLRHVVKPSALAGRGWRSWCAATAIMPGTRP